MTSVVLTRETTLGRTLIAESLFARLAARVVKGEGMPLTFAERIMDQTLAFLAACGTNHGQPLKPSRLVDIGWHTFILYTRDYAAFCATVAGQFIHHVPDDAPGTPALFSSATARAQTLAAIASAGFVVDEELWPAAAENCGSCHEHGNCSASGIDGNENADTRRK